MRDPMDVDFWSSTREILRTWISGVSRPVSCILYPVSHNGQVVILEKQHHSIEAKSFPWVWLLAQMFRGLLHLVPMTSSPWQTYPPWICLISFSGYVCYHSYFLWQLTPDRVKNSLCFPELDTGSTFSLSYSPWCQGLFHLRALLADSWKGDLFFCSSMHQLIFTWLECHLPLCCQLTQFVELFLQALTFHSSSQVLDHLWTN